MRIGLTLYIGVALLCEHTKYIASLRQSIIELQTVVVQIIPFHWSYYTVAMCLVTAGFLHGFDSSDILALHGLINGQVDV